MWIRTGGVIGVFVMAASSLPLAQGNVVRLSESAIKRNATARTMPEYPASSVASATHGVAVAGLVTRPDGSVTEVTILEAPDQAIGAAVREALMQWRCGPVTVQGRSEPHGLRGKVTFYFRIVSAKGRVFNPEDLPGGPKPEPASGPPPGGPGVGRARGGTPPGSAPAVVLREGNADAEIGETELLALASERPVILDIRERDEFARRHRPDAVNIPRDELSIRAYIELDRARPVVIDCSTLEARICHNAAASLRRGPGLTRVLVFMPSSAR